MIVWIHTYRPRPNWYELDAARREELTAAWSDVAVPILSDTISRVGPLTIRGQSTQERVEIWQFTTLAEIDSYWGALKMAGYADWMDSENMVATEPVVSELDTENS